MTFRTADIDTNNAAFNVETTTTARNVRNRRRARALSHRTSGVRIAGFGI